MKGLVIIHSSQELLDLNYTSEMEKAMYHAHGIGYAEYSRKLARRMDVEISREEDHRKSQLLFAGLDRRMKK
ncbi:hypothetical protein [Bacillus sp. SA1-12]|uniref:hypothetical protein n=1 Tax=Bacillus sp. SA1-12 TaxID=1455638 RepID=UPI0012E0103B|nr:hypothetical protein [Bacillus sp. SA1-12]